MRYRTERWFMPITNVPTRPLISTRSKLRGRRNTRCSRRCCPAPRTKPCLPALPNCPATRVPSGIAHAAVAEAARGADAADVEREYFALFIGLGRGELLPYGSYYLSGFLHDRPLARLREDLAQARVGAQRLAGGAGGPRGDPVRDHGRHGERAVSGSAGQRSPACSRSISRHGSGVSSPIWSERTRRTSIVRSARSARAFIDIETEAFALPA